MTFPSPIGTLVLAALAGSAFAGATYQLSDKIVPSTFYDSFTFETKDFNGGRVNYTDEETARRLNLTYTTDTTFVLRVDDTTVLDPSGPGRNSVRVHSNNEYTTHVVVFDMPHMPEGCSTWPAIWETSLVTNSWPNGGEVDIVEGVNDQEPNISTLHTSANCSIPASGVDQVGTTASTDCNGGCGVKYEQDCASFGPAFNQIGGGWYAMERTNDYIKIWFWSRDDSSVPSDAATGASSVDTSNWGTPSAYFPNTSCNFPAHFAPHSVIVNIEFCGDWAGNPTVYSAAGCPGTCVDNVNNNPKSFANAYFEFISINIYGTPVAQ